MQNNVETQQNRMYSFVYYSLPNGTLYLHRDFTGVRGNLNAMKLCLSYVQNSVQL